MIKSIKKIFRKLIAPKEKKKTILQKRTFIDLNITSKCNSTCLSCSIWKQKGETLPSKYAVKFLYEVRPFSKPDSLFSVLGGEPTLNPGLFNILRTFTKLGIKSSVVSNGYLLSNYNYAKEFVSAGPDKISFSLEGFEETNNKLRGENRFEQTIKAIQNLQKLNKNLSLIQSIICKENINELPEFIKWLKEKKYTEGVYLQALVQTFSEPISKTWYLHSKLWPNNYAQVCRKLEELIKLKQENPYFFHNEESQINFWKHYFKDPNQFTYQDRCNIGDFYLQLMANGDIKLCPFMEPIGNIKTNHVDELLYSKRATELRKKISNCNYVCNFVVNCGYKHLKLHKKIVE